MFERMFEKTSQVQSDLDTLKATLKIRNEERLALEAKHGREMLRLNADHEIALMKAQAETENAVLEAKNEALKEIVATKQENAVLKAEAVLQAKMLDLNADVLDIKDLVSKLIEALPKVNITGGLALNAGSCKKSE